MKLYQICELYCDYESNYLIVSDKMETEIKNDILEKHDEDCIMFVDVREIDKVDGYKIMLTKE